MDTLGIISLRKMYTLQSILARSAGRELMCGLALATASPARQIKARPLRKRFLHDIDVTEASEGPGAAHGALGPSQAEPPERVPKRLGPPRGPPRLQLDKFHAGTAYAAMGAAFAWPAAPRPGPGR